MAQITYDAGIKEISESSDYKGEHSHHVWSKVDDINLALLFADSKDISSSQQSSKQLIDLLMLQAKKKRLNKLSKEDKGARSPVPLGSLTDSDR